MDTDDPDLGDFIEGPKWKEQQVDLPPFPVDDDLIKVDIDTHGRPFTYYLDSKHLSPGNDGVIRYTVVIESTSGSRNVMVEGIHCINREYRTYAYGTADSKIVKTRTPIEWTYIEEKAGLPHRYDFFKNYMCGQYGAPLAADKIVDRIKYAENFGAGDENDD